MGDLSVIMSSIDIGVDYVAPSEYDPLPNDIYSVIISRAEVKETTAKTGSYLNLMLDVIEGQYQGRKFFTMIHLVNPNETCVRMGKAQMAQLCRAIGLLSMPQDSSEVCNKPFKVRTKIKPAKGEFKASNDIQEYIPLNATNTAPPQNMATMAPPPQQVHPQSTGNDDIPF